MIGRGMRSRQAQRPAQVDQTGAIDLQFLYRRAPGGCEAADLGEVVRPGKVFGPRLPAGMEEGSIIPRCRVNRTGRGELAAVAALTAKSQVF